jgi:hypothetical protein
MSMQTTQLKKLAQALRNYAKQTNDTKREKVANLVIAATGLELLRRKLED